ncbi:MAG TPA: amino acid--tRNA ligase-related protein, partial [Solirubrobacteraceae bacterium]|nr:amino acid--tRNA ligase-related protein [Solirubrobacteraceae bacterium]
PHPHDEEYVRALEYGLAPSASGGMGVDRLLMILTGRETLREVLPFPVMREVRSPTGTPTPPTIDGAPVMARARAITGTQANPTIDTSPSSSERSD